MSDKVEGLLEVGCNDNGEVVVNHPDLKPDENGVGHIVFSPDQARNLAHLLIKNATKADVAKIAAQRRSASEIPVDRNARVLTDGSPVTDDQQRNRPEHRNAKGITWYSVPKNAPKDLFVLYVRVIRIFRVAG